MLDARLVSLRRVLAQSDVLSVHCALNDETREYSIRIVFKMKPNAIFLNAARAVSITSRTWLRR
jgi:glyoxylate reductase